MSEFNKQQEEVFSKQRTETVAYKASEDFMEVLHDKDSFCYKPWQFSDYEVCADTLKTTYDEITIWGQQEAMIRPGWKIGENTVFVPNIFSKICGVHKDIGAYREEMNAFVDKENALFFKRFPLYKNRMPFNISKTYTSVLDRNGNIDKTRLLSSEGWKYRHLKPGLQEAIAKRIIEFCKLPNFWKYRNFKVNIRLSLIDRFLNYFMYFNDKQGYDEKLMKISTFGILMNLHEDLLKLLQNFDYPYKIPKIIVYNNGRSGSFTFSDAATLMFMNSMGVDILIYNPAGTSDIESFVSEEYFDMHRLEEITYNLPYRRNSFFYRLFRKSKV